MSYDLITIHQTHFNNDIKQTVNARDLHLKLQSKRQFANWIEDRLSDFIEGQDFLTNLLKTSGRPLIEYFLTIETAKHIAMLEKNEQGKKIRNYFIEKEKQANELQVSNFKVPTTFKEALQLCLQQEEEKELLQLENTKLQEEVKIKDVLHNVTDNICGLQEAGKKLHLKPNKFIEKLKENSYLRSNNQPYQKYIDCGYFELKTNVNEYVKDGAKLSKVFTQTYITAKGLHYFENRISTLFCNIMVA